MTEDTKRAMEAIKPMAKALGIEVTATENQLICNGQPIGIACNSTSATLKEFIGYLFLMVYIKDWGYRIPYNRTTVCNIREAVTQYWMDARAAQSAGTEQGEK